MEKAISLVQPSIEDCVGGKPRDMQINSLDRKIDEAVYELGVYHVPIFRDGRLTEEEIKIVEGR